ncbi:Metallo-dependent hydrolase [Mycena indigotica]|uniref:Metallo-dependent hydrolase n=1 Tax=Mycena indigotica TaxID=2126181 RepID=A0A8H6S2C8_9AGAR|nr:Metallo-dependent hydrolase [Mycena indigotica]KAF7290771.1 Metallo-dependent hydrolase [Mycena indigotica]
MVIAGPAAAALDSLDPSQREFIQSLPKAELHAHLNGCLPLSLLQDMASQYISDAAQTKIVEEGIAKLQKGIILDEIHDFFGLFPAIYALTSNTTNMRRATRAVLGQFLDGTKPWCSYLELRSTPRQTEEMTRKEYLHAVLDEVEQYPSHKAAFIVSLDRRMGVEELKECVDLACSLKSEGRRVVGIDLCGDPRAGDMKILEEYLDMAKTAGLLITLHIAETAENSYEETKQLLSYQPNRLGHATFLDDEAKTLVRESKMCIEICLSSNILCKTVPRLEDHHIRYYIQHDHPVVICTDDTLPFRTSLEGEYALLLALPPLGLGLTEVERPDLLPSFLSLMNSAVVSGLHARAGPVPESVIVFDVLTVIAFIILILSVTVARLSGIQRVKTWYLLQLSSAFCCLSFLFLVGHQTGPEPPLQFCAFSAALIYAAPPMVAAAALCFVIELYLRLSSALYSKKISDILVDRITWSIPMIHGWAI